MLNYSLDATFHALSDPARRVMVERLCLGPASVSDLAKPLAMTLPAVMQHLHPESVEVEIWRADELEVRRGLSSELDEMWSYVRSKANPRWLWHAVTT